MSAMGGTGLKSKRLLVFDASKASIGEHTTFIHSWRFIVDEHPTAVATPCMNKSGLKETRPRTGESENGLGQEWQSEVKWTTYLIATSINKLNIFCHCQTQRVVHCFEARDD